MIFILPVQTNTIKYSFNVLTNQECFSISQSMQARKITQIN